MESDGVKVVRKEASAVAGPDWFPLALHWAIADASVGSRHVCGGWFSLPQGAVTA